MQDRLIFPSYLEQAVTKELIRGTFPLVVWQDVSDESAVFMSDIILDIAPLDFFEWAYQTPSEHPVIFYCLNLSMELLLHPTSWMTDAVLRLKYDAPKRLTDGKE
jgi:hypothetical protein